MKIHYRPLHITIIIITRLFYPYREIYAQAYTARD